MHFSPGPFSDTVLASQIPDRRGKFHPQPKEAKFRAPHPLSGIHYRSEIAIEMPHDNHAWIAPYLNKKGSSVMNGAGKISNANSRRLLCLDLAYEGILPSRINHGIWYYKTMFCAIQKLTIHYAFYGIQVRRSRPNSLVINGGDVMMPRCNYAWRVSLFIYVDVRLEIQGPAAPLESMHDNGWSEPQQRYSILSVLGDRECILVTLPLHEAHGFYQVLRRRSSGAGFKYVPGTWPEANRRNTRLFYRVHVSLWKIINLRLAYDPAIGTYLQVKTGWRL
ncbi:hypothetical protein IW262DRAFT_1480988 [Armillaria fumosa]|nr:hypothetical protein IW262DRAFT_1480988 [Armillaria fumosa]